MPPIQEDNSRYLMIPTQEARTIGQPSVKTVEAAAATKVYLEQQYNSLLIDGPSPRDIRCKRLEQEMSEKGLGHEQRAVAKEQWFRSETDHLRQMRALKTSSMVRHDVKGITIAGYETVRVLGKGSFGVVRLVTDRSNLEIGNGSGTTPEATETVTDRDGSCMVKRNLPRGKPLSDVFAMKVIRKSEMLRSCQEGHLRAERDFLVSAEGSRWAVPLIASFQDNTNLYLVMEYMIGGDFLGLLLREDVLEESVAK